MKIPLLFNKNMYIVYFKSNYKQKLVFVPGQQMCGYTLLYACFLTFLYSSCMLKSKSPPSSKDEV